MNAIRLNGVLYITESGTNAYKEVEGTGTILVTMSPDNSHGTMTIMSTQCDISSVVTGFNMVG